MRLSATVSEHEHQVNLIKWFDLAYKPYSGRLFAIPNGGKRNITVAKKLKAEGVRKGVPDLFLPVSMWGYNGMFLELKIAKGKMNENQTDWQQFLMSQGYCTKTVYGFDEARLAIMNYLDKDHHVV